MTRRLIAALSLLALLLLGALAILPGEPCRHPGPYGAEVAARLATIERMHEAAAAAGYRLAEVEAALPGAVAAGILSDALSPVTEGWEETPPEWVAGAASGTARFRLEDP